MDFPMIDISGATILAIVVIIGNFLISRGMDQRDKRHVEDKLREQAHLSSLLFKWKDEHEKESSGVRLQFSKEISEVLATVKVNQTQYGEILRRLDTLDRKMDRIENGGKRERKSD